MLWLDQDHFISSILYVEVGSNNFIRNWFNVFWVENNDIGGVIIVLGSVDKLSNSVELRNFVY